MDTASIISDLASPHLSMMEIAERHALTLSALAAFITSDQGQEQLEQLQSAAAIRTRLIAQLHLPLAAAALSAILQSHCAASFTAAPTRESVPSANTPQHTNPLDIAARDESPPGDHARHAAPPTPQELNQPHSSHDAATFPPASSHVSAPSVSSPTIDHARTLRHQIELRRAAATLLRFAAFNHGHLARAASDPPRNASSSHNPISPRANAPHEQPQHIAHTAAPSGITLDPSPATPHTRAINTNPLPTLSNSSEPAAASTSTIAPDSALFPFAASTRTNPNPLASPAALTPSPFTAEHAVDATPFTPFTPFTPLDTLLAAAERAPAGAPDDATQTPPIMSSAGASTHPP